MGGEQAANTLVEVKLRQLEREGHPADAAILAQVREETLKAYEEQTSAYYSTSELWDDGHSGSRGYAQCVGHRHFGVAECAIRRTRQRSLSFLASWPILRIRRPTRSPRAPFG